MGRALEDMEAKLRSFVQQVYFSKSLQAVTGLYADQSYYEEFKNHEAKIHEALSK